MRSMYFCMASSLDMPLTLAQASHLARASKLTFHGCAPVTSPSVACLK